MMSTVQCVIFSHLQIFYTDYYLTNINLAWLLLIIT